MHAWQEVWCSDQATSLSSVAHQGMLTGVGCEVGKLVGTNDGVCTTEQQPRHHANIHQTMHMMQQRTTAYIINPILPASALAWALMLAQPSAVDSAPASNTSESSHSPYIHHACVAGSMVLRSSDISVVYSSSGNAHRRGLRGRQACRHQRWSLHDRTTTTTS